MTLLRTSIVAASLAAAGLASADAPLPGEESGRADAEPGDSSLRRVLRGTLLLPRIAIDLALVPIEEGTWVVERYQLADRFDRWFFNDAGTVGVVPTLALERGFGVNVGARFVDRDVFGAHERLDVRASTGGRYHELVATKFRTGERLGRASLVAGAEFERRPHETSYGTGNVDDAAESIYKNRVARATAGLDVRLGGGLHARAATEVADHELDGADLGGGVRVAYGELELRYDSRRTASPWVLPSVPTTGWLAAAFAGRSVALDASADFTRYGFDLQRFVALGNGSRVLSFRASGEAVTGAAEVPFIQLPRIGGRTTLRGYPVDRFRDRAAVSGSAEYQWDLGRFVSASVFADAGKVAASVSDLDVHHLRVGYGVSLEGHASHRFIARATLASSIDGGVFFNVELDPVFELEDRTGR